MHELSIARSIHDLALEEALRHEVGEVLTVTCRVGVLQHIVPPLLEAAFETVTSGTPLAGSTLRIETEPIRAKCDTCGKISLAFELSNSCPACGSPRIHFFGGMDMHVMSIAVEDEENSHEHSGTTQCA